MSLRLILVLPVFIIIPAAHADEPTLVVTQDNDVAGPQTVYLTHNAMKMVSKRTGASLLVKAPDFKVHFYNPNMRLAYETTIEHWHGIAAWGSVLDRDPNLVEKAGASAKLWGLTVSHSIMDLQPHPNHHVRGADYWYAEQPSIPKQFFVVWEKSYGLPFKNGIPIKYDHWDDVITHPLVTTSVKQTKLPASFFCLPAGLKRVQNSEDVVYSDSSKQDLIKDMIEQIK